jgi:ADP-heptose:LPS heptosyltransferase
VKSVVKQKPLTKVLIIRFSSIGDIVLTSPVVRCLKNQSPDTEIHFLTKKQHHSLLINNPYISKIWLFEDNFRELIPLLKAENFSFVVDLHKNFRSRFVILKLRKPSASFPKLNFLKWLLVNTKINMLPDVHVVDRYFRAVRKLKIHNDGNGLDFFIPMAEEVDLSGILSEHPKDYIAFSIGGKHNTKIFPEEKIISVCKSIKKPLFLLGGAGDKDRADRIISQCVSNVINGCGKYTINQSASVIRQSEKVITNDTGLMHIAAAFRKPVISIWGNTVPAFGMYPYLPEEFIHNSKIHEIKNLSCRPCSKLGYNRCPKKHFRCMTDQDVDYILKSLED